MFKFLYRNRKPAKSLTTPPQVLNDVRTWRATGNPTYLQRAVNAGLDCSTHVDAKLGNVLHVCAQHSYLESLFVLHATGLRDNKQNPEQQHAVHLAAAVGFRDGVLYILKNMGGDIDARNGQGATPLMLAIQNDRLDVASALLARGAVVTRGPPGRPANDAHLSSALHMCKSPQMLRLLLTNTTLHIDTRSMEGMTLLHMSCAHGDTATAAECLALGANCSSVDHDKANAMHHACRNGAAHIIPLLIKAGCRANDPDSRGFTAVEVALLQHDCDTAYALYCAGALFTKRQLLLLSILLRHSSLLRAIRCERKEFQEAVVVGVVPAQELAPSLADPASKVETLSAALLSGPQSMRHSPSIPNLANLVVSVGNVPEHCEINADNLSDAFRNIHDPVPRPMGTDSSAVLVSVYSRFLRHSDSSVSAGVAKWRTARVGRVPGTQQQTLIEENASLDPMKRDPMARKRYSESVLDIDATKTGFWTSTKGHPPGGPVALGKHKDARMLAPAQLERQEAASKLDSACYNSGGRSSLDRLLPHYLRGLSHFVNQRSTPKEELTQNTPPVAAPEIASQNSQGITFTRRAPAAAAPVAQHTHQPHALGSFAPVHTSATQKPAQVVRYPNAPPPQSLNGAAAMGGDAHHGHMMPNRPPPRRSFCGEVPPEAAAFAVHRSRNIRNSALFTTGRTEAAQHPSGRRRSRTFDFGYRHSEILGLPAARGDWGQPQAVPGPGGASGNPMRKDLDPSRRSQDDMVLMHERPQLPVYGEDLAADGMLEFEEMMARRVQLFHAPRPLEALSPSSSRVMSPQLQVMLPQRHIYPCSTGGIQGHIHTQKHAAGPSQDTPL